MTFIPLAFSTVHNSGFNLNYSVRKSCVYLFITKMYLVVQMKGMKEVFQLKGMKMEAMKRGSQL